MISPARRDFPVPSVPQERHTVIACSLFLAIFCLFSFCGRSGRVCVESPADARLYSTQVRGGSQTIQTFFTTARPVGTFSFDNFARA